MTLKDFIELFGTRRIMEWLKETLKFYFKPSLFFKRFFVKASDEKAAQVLFYISIWIIGIFILTNLSIKEAAKTAIIETIFVFGGFFILSITRFILVKFFKERLLIEKIFY